MKKPVILDFFDTAQKESVGFSNANSSTCPIKISLDFTLLFLTIQIYFFVGFSGAIFLQYLFFLIYVFMFSGKKICHFSFTFVFLITGNSVFSLDYARASEPRALRADLERR